MTIASKRVVSRMIAWAGGRYLGKPDQVELLGIKFPTMTSALNAALNETAYRARSSKTFRLTSLNIEVTNFCNLRCSFCPVNNGMQRVKRYLDSSLFRRLIDETPSLEFILPFQWGEPLLHPEIASMIRYASDRGIRSYLTTNGTLLTEDIARDLCRSGLERLTFSIDGDDETHEVVRGVPLQVVRDKIDLMKNVRRRLGQGPRIDVSMVIDDTTEGAYQTYLSTWRHKVDRVQAIPKMVEAPRRTPCRELWRGTLVVMADGRVTVCCVDSEGDLAIGHVDESTPSQLYKSKSMKQLRRAHANGCFPDKCQKCGEYDASDLGVNKRFQR